MDSELQIALIGAGIAAVVLIVGYNKWQERKHRRQAEQAFKSEHRDVLLEPRAGEGLEGGERGSSTPRERAAQREPSERVEPGFGAGEPARPFREAPVKRSEPDMPELLDARADCVIRLEAIEPLDVQRVWKAQQQQLSGLSKPVRWFGFNDADNLWHPLGANSAGAFHWFCAALQLVDRHGAIGETDFMRFSGGVQRVADLVVALPPALPARGETLGRANELDRFCADVDVQIGVNIIANAKQFEGGQIMQLAEAHGMVLAGDGCFHARDAEGNTVFTLANVEPDLFAAETASGVVTSALTLVIDVPRVADGVAAFDRLMRTATDFADKLQGSIVDDNRAPFGDEAADMIRSQITQFQERMASHDIPAGSALANRLFAV